ncbi:MAG TPA: hypothetical protein VED46_18630 [Alphaproteobacteria bacterium]|nr:hypothetical protein [Alphaproteobacteria bacterium]
MTKPTSSDLDRPCAAVTREGHACRNAAMPGQPLCRRHAGGAATLAGSGPDSIYDGGIGEEERRLWESISVTDLDAEIRIAKLQLKRLIAAQRRAELAEENHRDAAPPNRKTSKPMSMKTRTIDYDERVNRLLGRISDLVATRAKLQREAEADSKGHGHDPADDPVERLARRIDRVAARMKVKSDKGEHDEGGGGKSDT